ncbi:citramalyl-CoA lyase, mitochondrial-like [Oscarella lobularis]|uniref:citramalyl-CoA lyase, mitochondrial-like n=1 Tax=Oscarella lobularis TaxID=121494 RepID=UPI003313C37E
MAARFSFVRRLSSSALAVRPRRTIMYVPGSDERKVEKAKSLDADTLVFDCEDGVAYAKKKEARSLIVRALEQMQFGRSERVVRINSMDSGLAEDDLVEILRAVNLPDAILLPKVETAEIVARFQSKVESLIPSDVTSYPFLAIVESARALVNIKEICDAGTRGKVHLSGLTFGADDYAASIGAVRTKSSSEVLCARQLVVMHAKAYGLQAVDMVNINYKDLEGLKAEAQEGATMGFTGKQVIHPDQIPVVHAAFSPSLEQIKSAKNLIKAFERHQAEGKGAFTYEGKMIDMPTVLQAKNVTDLAKAIGD